MSDQESRRPRILQVSFACDPNASMESRLSWNRAVESAKEYDTWVICQPIHVDCQGRALPKVPPVPGLTIHHIDPGPLDWLGKIPGLFYLAYHLYQFQVLRAARTLHQRHEFDLVHQVSFCGYREPGYLWDLDIPFVWGPIGGTQNFPVAYLNLLGPYGAVFEIARNLINSLQIRLRPRVRKAAMKAAHVWSANSTAKRDLKHFLQTNSELQLETGLADLPPWQARERQVDEPLRILWAGRLQPWKALPLLLKALHEIREGLPFELRIIGYGPQERQWLRMVNSLGLGDRTEFVGWPVYENMLPHYEWADVFAFTSLRDTSGTGLLEALATGCPIIAVDHQGAKDIVTADCGVKISVSHPESTIREFQMAFHRLHESPTELQRLSQGARTRATEFLWSNLGSRMRRVYASIVEDDQPNHPELAGPMNKLVANEAMRIRASRLKQAAIANRIASSARSDCRL